MKRIFVLLTIAFFLVACGDVKVHEDVDEEVAKDVLQLMDVVTKNVDKDILYEDASSNDKNLVDTYYKKYLGEFSIKKDLYDGVNEDILIISNATAVRYEQGITLDTEKDDLKESEERLKEFVKTGKGYDHNDDDKEDSEGERRSGVSSEIIDDASELVKLIEELVEGNTGFEELDEEGNDYKLINTFDSNGYKEDEEEYSSDEDYIITSLDILVSDYKLYGVEGLVDGLKVDQDSLLTKIESVNFFINEAEE